MKKTLKKLFNEVFHSSMERTLSELSDISSLMSLTERVGSKYSGHSQSFNDDIDLGNKFRKLFDNSLVAMSFYDKDGYLLDLNQKMRDLCAIDTIGEEYFRNTRIFDTPDFKDNLDPLSHDPFLVCQHMCYPELNIDRYIEVLVQPTFDAKQQLMYYVITSRDITAERLIYLQQKRQSDELQQVGKSIGEYEKRLHNILRASNMYVWSMDMKARKIVFSRSLSRRDFEETIDEYVESIYDDERDEAIEHLKQLMANPEPFNRLHHFRYTPASNQPQWLAISGQPVFDSKGRQTGMFGILRDVTEFVEIQDQLRMEQTRAKASGMMKSVYLANMSHEIRTPLNAIVGFSDLLQYAEDSNQRQEFIRVIRDNCDMLLRLINDVIEASDMQQTLNLEVADVDFSQVFNDTCQTMRQRVNMPGVEFISENPYATFNVSIDKSRVQQVITNFVTNAIKYTHQGYIKVGYRQETRNAIDGFYVYCEDTGAGIPLDKQPMVFDRFVKLNDTVQGTGLGLSICKNITENCGGEIGVKSLGEGHGSTFWFWMPRYQKN